MIWPAIPPALLISSMAISAPSRIFAASAASAPVNGKLMPITTVDGIMSWAEAIRAAAGAMRETNASPAMNDGASRRPKNLRMYPPLGCSPSTQVWRNSMDALGRCQRVSGCETFGPRTDLCAARCSNCLKGRLVDAPRVLDGVHGDQRLESDKILRVAGVERQLAGVGRARATSSGVSALAQMPNV